MSESAICSRAKGDQQALHIDHSQLERLVAITSLRIAKLAPAASPGHQHVQRVQTHIYESLHVLSACARWEEQGAAKRCMHAWPSHAAFVYALGRRNELPRHPRADRTVMSND